MARTRMSFLRPFTTHLLNPLARRVAGWLPGFGILSYVGRKSGRTYRTPLNVFKRGDGYVFALTYGSEVHGSRTCSPAARPTCAHADAMSTWSSRSCSSTRRGT